MCSSSSTQRISMWQFCKPRPKWLKPRRSSSPRSQTSPSWGNRTAEVEKYRSTKLLLACASTPSDFGNRNNTAQATAANVEAIRQSLASAKAREGESLAKVESARIHLDEVKSNAPRQVAARRATLAMRKANLDLARAQLSQAELNRSYAT